MISKFPLKGYVLFFRSRNLGATCSILFPSGGRLARGGGNPEPALIHVLKELKAVKGASVGHCTLDAKPLPTTRPRLFFFVGMQGTDGEALAREAENLSEALRALPQHHLASFLLAQETSGAKASSPDDSSGVTGAMRVKEYHAAFAVGLNKAVQKKRLPADITPGPDAERPSMTHSALKEQSPWLQAQADVFFLIGKTLLQKQPEEACIFFTGGALLAVTDVRYLAAMFVCTLFGNVVL